MGYTAKYPENFRNYEYVNPEAKKGGTMRLSAFGTYESLNPFLLKSLSPAGLNDLVFETLMDRSLDEPSSSYAHIASGYKLAEDGKTRLETMVRTNDGFEIAEQDLRLRGPGDIMGTQQSGVLDFKLADLAKDAQLVQLSKNDVDDLLKIDPDLVLKENQTIRKELVRQTKLKPNWSNIS